MGLTIDLILMSMFIMFMGVAVALLLVKVAEGDDE